MSHKLINGVPKILESILGPHDSVVFSESQNSAVSLNDLGLNSVSENSPVVSQSLDNLRSISTSENCVSTSPSLEKSAVLSLSLDTLRSFSISENSSVALLSDGLDSQLMGCEA